MLKFPKVHQIIYFFLKHVLTYSLVYEISWKNLMICVSIIQVNFMFKIYSNDFVTMVSSGPNQ